MPITDLYSVINWWKIFFLIGICFFPITSLIFNRLIDKGYIFSKVLGMLAISYLLFILGVLHISTFNIQNTFLALFVITLLNVGVLISSKNNTHLFFKTISFKNISLFFIEELLFFSCLTFWSFIRGFSPDIHGLEKYMDYGFVNSILRSSYFPPKDMWFSPESINYYYFGHLITAIITRMSGIPSYITYNLMIATLFAFSFVCAFSLGVNLLYQFGIERSIQKNIFIKYLQTISIGVGGIFTAMLLSFGGNLHTLYALFLPYQNDNPVPPWQLKFSFSTFPNSYWYPNATRFIYNTIHEFPLYSFVVSDLHGHVLGIPIVLTIVALLFHAFLEKKLSPYTIILLSFLIACAYMTNAWDGLTYLLLTAVIVWGIYNPNITLNFVTTLRKPFLTICIIFIGFIVFSLPFSIHFKPPVSGVGILCAPDFLTSIGKIGPFLFEANHCQKSPLWQLVILYGFFYFWAFILGITIFRSKKRYQTDTFVALLILISTILIVIPEFIYFKDIYPAHYRANTMFKLTYQAFMLLSISTGYSILRSSKSIRPTLLPLALGGIGLISFILIYPFFAINSYYGDLKNYHGLNGITYLKNSYPNDYEAITWLNKNINGQPVILEAQGDSYTDFGRVSINTGMPTVLGWTVHEWLWRGTYDIPAPRIAEVQRMYESQDIGETKSLLQKYNVKYVFIGDLERQKYLNIFEEKFTSLGSVIYSSGQTEIYKIN